MTHDPTFVAIIERNLSYFTDEFAAANGNAGELLQSERENIFDAVKYAARIPSANYHAAKLLTNIAPLIEQNDSPSQWSQVFIRVLNRYNHADTQAICNLYNRLGYFSCQAGEYRRSIKIYQRSLDLASEQQHRFEMAFAKYGIGANYFRLSDLPRALAEANAAQELLEALHAEGMTNFDIFGNVNNLRGLLALSRGELEEAQGAFDNAIDMFGRSDNLHLKGLVLLNVALLLSRKREYAQAEVIAASVVDQFETAGGWWLSSCEARTFLGNILLLQERWRDALDTFNHISAHELRKRGHYKRCADLHNNLGTAHYHLQQFASARSHLEESLETYKEFSPSPDWAAAMAILAATYAYLGFRKRAKQMIAESSLMLNELGDVLHVSETWQYIEVAKAKLRGKR